MQELTVYRSVEELEPWMRESIARHYGALEPGSFVVVVRKEGESFYMVPIRDDSHEQWSLFLFVA